VVEALNRVKISL